MGTKIGIIIGILILLVIVGFFYVTYDEEKRAVSFCKDNGYDGVEKASWNWEKSYCFKEENGNLIKKEIDTCNRRGQTLYDWCFVKMEDSQN